MNILFACTAAIIVNSSDYPWNKFDQNTYLRSLTRCYYYFSDAPCVKKFEKRGERNYWVTCGKEK